MTYTLTEYDILSNTYDALEGEIARSQNRFYIEKLRVELDRVRTELIKMDDEDLDGENDDLLIDTATGQVLTEGDVWARDQDLVW